MACQKGLECSFVGCLCEHRRKLLYVTRVELMPVNFMRSEFGRWVDEPVWPRESREFVCGECHRADGILPEQRQRAHADEEGAALLRRAFRPLFMGISLAGAPSWVRRTGGQLSPPPVFGQPGATGGAGLFYCFAID